MNRTSWKCLLIGAVVVVALFSVVPQADAQWWGYYRPAACGGCYTRLRVAVLLVLFAVLCQGELQRVLLRQRLVSGRSARTGPPRCSDLVAGITPVVAAAGVAATADMAAAAVTTSATPRAAPTSGDGND